MPDLGAVLNVVRVRWQIRATLFALAVGGAVFALAWLVASMPTAAITGGVAVALLLVSQPHRSTVDAAHAVEAFASSLDNLIVTAAELDARPRPVSAEIRDAIAVQAADRLRRVNPSDVVPLGQPIVVVVLVAIGCALLAGLDRGVVRTMAGRPDVAGIISTSHPGFIAQVTPPAYAKRPAMTVVDPPQLTVISGSRVRMESANGVTLRDWVATESAGLEISLPGTSPRFLSVIVVPDLPPSVRVVAPGQDLAFAAPAGQVAVSIQTGDDLGLAALALRFTKVSGGGENVSFSEGEVPLRIERRNDREWVGRTDVSLAGLGLDDGDILVYRAIARDTNPNGAAVQSDQYLIEIGRNAQIADAGFSLPSEEKRYAISQQMVIYKTEQLLGRPRPEDFREQARDLAMEQRMVRAEVVFLSGGEVEDEVEEAAHSHELAEGRLENSGRAEMVRAINAMSRAEARLNDGAVKEALVFEREALVHLERALDRRRYFLRTLPDRSRIDATRRLTGDRREAASWNRARHAALAPGSMAALRRVMRELATGTTVDAALAARIAAVDPSSVELQNAAVALASAGSEAARQVAARTAMQALTTHALKSLPLSSAVDLRLDPLAGRLADQMVPPK